jgi:hypothetical protein
MFGRPVGFHLLMEMPMIAEIEVLPVNRLRCEMGYFRFADDLLLSLISKVFSCLLLRSLCPPFRVFSL